jgi:hypothetical protein
LNQSIQAKAFTTGQDVFFRQGAYDPGSRGGQELIAHELTHVVQQNGGAVRGEVERKSESEKPSESSKLPGEIKGLNNPERNISRMNDQQSLQAVFTGDLQNPNFDYIHHTLKDQHKVIFTHKQFREMKGEPTEYSSYEDLLKVLNPSQPGAQQEGGAQQKQQSETTVPEVIAEVAEKIVQDKMPKVAAVVSNLVQEPAVGKKAEGVRKEQPKKLNTIAKANRAIEAKAKHALMEKISKGMQNSSKFNKLKPKILNGSETPNQRTVKINMSLKGDQAKEVVNILVGSSGEAVVDMVINELKPCQMSTRIR